MSTEISTVQPRGLALDTFEDAFRFSKLVATSDFAPKDFRGKPESCLLAIQHGAELGLSPMQSLQSDCCRQRPAERLRRHGLGRLQRLTGLRVGPRDHRGRRRAHGCRLPGQASRRCSAGRKPVWRG
jgi:hypothetical protein